MRAASFCILLALFIAALSVGIALLVVQSRPGSPGVEILLPTATTMPTATMVPTATPAPDLPVLKVYISGAIAMPGVYTMQEGDRLADAIEAAGGATHGPLPSCINLAVRVKGRGQLQRTRGREALPTARFGWQLPPQERVRLRE